MMSRSRRPASAPLSMPARRAKTALARRMRPSASSRQTPSLMASNVCSQCQAAVRTFASARYARSSERTVASRTSGSSGSIR